MPKLLSVKMHWPRAASNKQKEWFMCKCLYPVQRQSLITFFLKQIIHEILFLPKEPITKFILSSKDHDGHLALPFARKKIQFYHGGSHGQAKPCRPNTTIIGYSSRTQPERVACTGLLVMSSWTTISWVQDGLWGLLMVAYSMPKCISSLHWHHTPKHCPLISLK